MRTIIRSIQKWMKKHRKLRELKRDQALRERCVDYMTRCMQVDKWRVNDLVDYIKNGMPLHN